METMKARSWSNSSILKALPNPTEENYEINMTTPEVTFLGIPNQPDFATLHILMHPGDTVIELRSLKLYLHDFRNRVLSYERFINVVFKDFMAVYKPKRLRLTLETRSTSRGNLLEVGR